MKITKLYNKLSILRDKNIPLVTPFVDWIRYEVLWNKYYEENN